MTYDKGWMSFHNKEKRALRKGLMWLKGWDDAKFGHRRNGTHPKLDYPYYNGPQNLARAVDLGYAQ